MFSLMTATALLSALVSCGMNKGGDVRIADMSEKKSGHEKNNSYEICDSYEEGIERLFENINNDNIADIISLSYTDEYYNIIRNIAESNNISLEKMFRETYIPEMKNISLNEIISVEPLESEDIELMSESYSDFRSLGVYTAGYKKIQNISYYAEDKYSFEPEECVSVNCNITYTDDYNIERNDTAEIWLYLTDGEGWKTDVSYMGYIKNSMRKNIESDMMNLYTATCSILNNLNSNNYSVPLDNLIISSDDSMNFNVSNAFAERLKKELDEVMNEYFPESADTEYFIVMQEGKCIYTAGYDKENPDYIGTCPSNKVVTPYDLKTAKEDYTYDYLYKGTLNAID
ncbi:MAG: hypothetical protein NC177_01495 [Ruminococcus flavefaciens]|nr:hypothetical protein [Ruminococcus flavefaciens]